ncbi:MAG: alpha/beta fold hydrolase [Nocardiaceae bacterium]|nr:alpha/beta fold hydrolase [Nocardiaceae bacterium]
MAEVSIALRNLWALSFGDGVEPREPTPSTTVYNEPHRHLRRYQSEVPATGKPVLMVPPLAVTIACYDLRPGQSLIRFLLDAGRPVYVIDYGEITYADRHLGFEEWTEDIVPAALRRVSEAHGGETVDVIGWSFGGTISVLTAASHPELPISSVTAVGTPFDQRRNPGSTVPRAIGQVTGGREVVVPTRLLGGIPKYLVRAGFRAQAFDRELKKPLFIARNLTDTEALARMQSVDRFMAEMPGYPGRFYRQVWRSLMVRNEMWEGTVRLAPDTTIELSNLRCPVLLLGSRRDVLAPAGSVAAGVEVLTGAASARFVEVPGSHLGMIAGPQARETSWAAITEFHAEASLVRV